jgi:hypothetical protein
MINFNHNGFAEQRSSFALQSAEKVNEVLGLLPKASPLKLWTTDFDAETPETAKAVENFKAIYVTSEKESGIVNCPSRDRYTVIQHSDAIKPIIDALTEAGVENFDFNAQATLSWARLNIFIGASGFDGVKLGFSISNSFDSSGAVQFGVEVDKVNKTISLRGFRLSCSNGMMIEVPLDQAEIIRPEIREQVQNILREKTRVLHTKSAQSKIDALKFTVEAIALLHKPVENFIKKAKAWTINDSTHFKELIKTHVGRRFATKVINQYNKEPDESLWSLYNACTFCASHDATLSTTARETLLQKASDMLLVEMYPKPEVKK